MALDKAWQASVDIPLTKLLPNANALDIKLSPLKKGYRKDVSRRARKDRRDFLPVPHLKASFFVEFAFFKLCALRVQWFLQ